MSIRKSTQVSENCCGEQANSKSLASALLAGEVISNVLPEFAKTITDHKASRPIVPGSITQFLFRLAARADVEAILASVPNRFWNALTPAHLHIPVLSSEGGFPTVALDPSGAVNLGDDVESMDRSFVQALLATALRNLTASKPGPVVPLAPFSAQLEIVSFNVWGVPAWLGARAPRRYPEIGRQLAASSFHIVGLQEMWERRTRAVIHRANFPHIAHGGKYPGLRDTSGLVTLSRYPIVATHFHPFRDSTFAERIVKKGVLLTTIRTPIGDIEVMNVHLCSDSDRSMTRVAEIRMRQIAEIGKLIEAIAPQRPVFLLGDFNTSEGHVDSDALYSVADHDLFDLTHQNLPDGVHVPRATYDYERNTWASKYKNVGVRNESSRLDRILLKGRPEMPVIVETDYCFKEPAFGKKIHLSDHFGVRTILHYEVRIQN